MGSLDDLVPVAAAAAQLQHKGMFTTIRLIFVGHDGRSQSGLLFSEDILAAANGVPRDRIMFVPTPNDQKQLLTLLAPARAVIFSSSIEIVSWMFHAALRIGVPIASTSIPAFAEYVAQAGGLSFAPGDVDAISQIMHHLAMYQGPNGQTRAIQYPGALDVYLAVSESQSGPATSNSSLQLRLSRSVYYGVTRALSLSHSKLNNFLLEWIASL
jgi:hypothetical protein